MKEKMSKTYAHYTLFQGYPDILTARQVQQLLGIGRHSTYHLLETNQIHCFKIGNSYKIPKSSLIHYVLSSSGRGDTK